jgi:hypothetical protein
MSIVKASRRPAGCLSDFLFDRLMANDLAGDPAAEDVRTHLVSCAQCRNRLTEFEAVQAPPFGSLFALSIARKPRRGATRWAVPAVALAAAAVLMVSVRFKRNDDPPAGARTKGALASASYCAALLAKSVGRGRARLCLPETRCVSKSPRLAPVSSPFSGSTLPGRSRSTLLPPNRRFNWRPARRRFSQAASWPIAPSGQNVLSRLSAANRSPPTSYDRRRFAP